MKENENPCETLKCLRAGFFIIIIIFYMGRAELNLGILFLG